MNGETRTGSAAGGHAPKLKPIVSLNEDFAKLVPSEPEAERAVLGCLMAYPEARFELSDITPTLFFAPANQLIFTSIAEMHIAKLPVDLVTLTSWLRDNPLLEKAGGHSYLTQVQSDAVTAVSAQHHVGNLRKKAAKRELIVLGRETADAAMNGTGVDVLLKALQEAATRVAATLDPRTPGGFPEIVDLSECLRNPPSRTSRGHSLRASKASFSDSTAALRPKRARTTSWGACRPS